MATAERKGASSDLSRAEYAYARLMEMLRLGELRPGQRLREIDLAEKLDVSRTPIREALRRVASEGLAQYAEGRGLVVPRYDKQQVRELYELRAALEGTAAALATRHASPDEIDLMRVIVKQGASAIGDPEDMRRINARFHLAIHEAAHNRYLKRALAQMSDALALLDGTTFSVPGRAEEAQSEHLAILDALQNRDPANAEILARLHIERAGAARLRMMFADTEGRFAQSGTIR